MLKEEMGKVKNIYYNKCFFCCLFIYISCNTTFGSYQQI